VFLGIVVQVRFQVKVNSDDLACEKIPRPIKTAKAIMAYCFDGMFLHRIGLQGTVFNHSEYSACAFSHSSIVAVTGGRVPG
jgi:hypothetical protein